MALVIIGVAMLFFSARYAHADHYRADSDGHVPIKRLNCANEPKDMRNSFGRTLFSINERTGVVRARILLNLCLIQRAGRGQEQIRKTLAHEKAHSEGWKHYEKNPQVNAAYEP